jgi:hypothetical protein
LTVEDVSPLCEVEGLRDLFCPGEVDIDLFFEVGVDGHLRVISDTYDLEVFRLVEDGGDIRLWYDSNIPLPIHRGGDRVWAVSNEEVNKPEGYSEAVPLNVHFEVFRGKVTWG